MTTTAGIDRTQGAGARPGTLVWIDATEAIIVRLHGGRARIECVESDVPPHRRATGHVRHDPAIRHGGGGSPQTAGEPHRIEHLKRFVLDVADRSGSVDDLLILGQGTVHERLARHLAESDANHGRHRAITCEVSPRLTDRQLIARLRRFAGVEPRRRTVGAYRWSQPSAGGPSGRSQLVPRRVVDKPQRRRGQEAPGE
jgi:hypothetical protein